MSWLADALIFIEPVGTLFIRLITMIVIPLVVASLLIGTASLGNIRRLRRMGGKTITYYLCTTALAVTMGLLVSNLIEPGARIDPATRDRLAAQLQGEAAGRLAIAEATPPLRDVLVNIVPRNPVQAAADFELLPLIVFTVILGAAVSLLTAERKRSVVTFFEGVNDASGTVIGWVMRLAPYAVFALLGAVVARFGLDVLRSLLIYAVTVLDLVVERDSPRDHGDRRTTPRHLPRGEQLRAAARRHDQRPARHS